MSDKVSVNIKKVNIIAPIPVRTVFPNIYGKKDGLSMSPANILKCLLCKATVYEVLSDGSTVKLNFNNYNKINKPIIRSTKPKEKSKQIATKSGSAIGNSEIKKNMVMKDTSENIDDAIYKEAYHNMLVEKSINTGINISDMVDTLKDNNGNDVELPKETIEKNKPAEINEISKEEEDPELVEIAAEIAKLEAEEAANISKDGKVESES